LTAAIVAPAEAPAPAPTVLVGRNPPNAIFAEVLGNGLTYSLNYERIFAPWTSGPWSLGIRGGASYVAYKISDAAGSGVLHLASFPVVVSWYVGLPHHKLQLGLGATLLYVSAIADASGTTYSSTSEGFGIAATAVIGYRYMPEHTGFTFGVGFTPLLRATKGFLPWGGASAGIAF
jgi:hypothetical protein